MSKVKINEGCERKIKLCIEAINKMMSYSEAVLCYKIVKTTIFCRLKVINGAAGVGRPSAISQAGPSNRVNFPPPPCTGGKLTRSLSH